MKKLLLLIAVLAIFSACNERKSLNGEEPYKVGQLVVTKFNDTVLIVDTYCSGCNPKEYKIKRKAEAEEEKMKESEFKEVILQ